ncbi:MAG: carboxylesterase [Proteobacteria bacterium]|nr:carboxylesterase [Pseudomonadota bacterium]
MTSILPAVEIETRPNPNASIIWLHGLGADGHDFTPLIPQLQLPPDLAIRFIFPHAPHRPITLNRGYVMPAWYDVYELKSGIPEDDSGIKSSSLLIDQWIDLEIKRGIPSERILLAGFSQGGAMALFTGLQYKKTLGGILGLATYLPLANHVIQHASAANKNMPILMLHGIGDPVVKMAWGFDSYQILKQQGYPIQWMTYEMQHHSVSVEEIIECRRWIIERLAAVKP